MDTVDEHIPEPERDIASSSRRRILNHWTWQAASGRIDRGVVRVNDEIEIKLVSKKNPKVVVTGVEMSATT